MGPQLAWTWTNQLAPSSTVLFKSKDVNHGSLVGRDLVLLSIGRRFEILFRGRLD